MQRDEMYSVKVLSGDRRHLVFAKRVEVPLTVERRARLTHDLQATHVACDFSGTDYVLSGWLKHIARETEEAQSTGRVIGCVLSDGVMGDAELVGVRNSLRRFGSVEEVWAE